MQEEAVASPDDLVILKNKTNLIYFLKRLTVTLVILSQLKPFRHIKSEKYSTQIMYLWHKSKSQRLNE